MKRSATLERHTPLRRKRPTPRRRGEPRCDWLAGCRASVVIGVAVDEFYCRTHARRVADELTRQVVKERDGYTCQRCSSTAHTTTIDWAHLLGRNVAPSLRWDLDAAIALCRRCHIEFTAHPTAWRIWIARRYPGRWEILNLRRRDPAPDVPDVIVAMRARLEEAA